MLNMKEPVLPEQKPKAADDDFIPDVWIVITQYSYYFKIKKDNLYCK